MCQLRDPGSIPPQSVCSLCGADNIIEIGFSSNTSVFPCQYLLMVHIHLHLSTVPLVTEGKAGEGCEPCHKAGTVMHIGEHSTHQYLHFCLLRI